jgi:hypothetical protein
VVVIVGLDVHKCEPGEGVGAKRIKIQAIAAQIQSAYGLQEVEGGSVVSQRPLPW